MHPLKAQRRRRAMSQRDLATASGVSRSTIHEIERGHQKSLPWPSTIGKLAAALGCAPVDIMETEDEPQEAAVG